MAARTCIFGLFQRRNAMAATLHAILATVSDRPGMLFGLTKVLAEHGANIRYVDMHTTADHAEVYLEFAIEGDAARLVADYEAVGVHRVVVHGSRAIFVPAAADLAPGGAHPHVRVVQAQDLFRVGHRPIADDPLVGLLLGLGQQFQDTVNPSEDLLRLFP